MEILNRKKRIWKHIVLLYLFALLIFSPAIYYLLTDIIPCKARFENDDCKIIVTGKSFGKAIYTKGINSKFEYNYKNKKYETGHIGNFRNAPLEQILVFIKIDSLRPDCYKVLFDSIFTNDTIQIEYFMKNSRRHLKLK